MEGGRELPVVEVVVRDGREEEEESAMRVVGQVLECILSRMKVEMFGELMELMG